MTSASAPALDLKALNSCLFIDVFALVSCDESKWFCLLLLLLLLLPSD